MSADPSLSIPPAASTSSSTTPSPLKPARSNPYNLNSPRVPFRQPLPLQAWSLPPPKAEPKPLRKMSESNPQPQPSAPTESKQRFRVPSSSNAFNTIRSTLVALSDATAPAPRSRSKPPRPKQSEDADDEDEDVLCLAYGLADPPSLSYDIYSGPPPSYDQACLAPLNAIGGPQRQESSTADTIRSIARKVRKELVNGGR